MTDTATAPETNPGTLVPEVRLHPLRARSLTVSRVRELSARMRRITFVGADLEGFAADGPADHVKVFFPADATGSTPDELMPRTEDGSWVNRPDPALVFRDYTVRSFEPGSGELVIDMLCHSHGVAGRWAAQARPGQRLGVLGPRGSVVGPFTASQYLFVVDETGLPALANWLERLPETAYVTAFVSIEEPEDELPLRVGPRTEVIWLVRGRGHGREHGSDGAVTATDVLARAVAQAGRTVAAAGSDGWTFVGAEYSQVRAVRTVLRSELGVARDRMDVSGYWRAGQANFDHHTEIP
ncbi:MAG: siderophore-interacting protein [Actinomycetales bacterium]|nr:siderophore-interacting protein [Actinomycetales bacterium]